MAKHARLSASGSSIWLNCPGSVKLSEGKERRSSSFAAEGTAAHALAEHCLKNQCRPHGFLGATFEEHVVDEEMADAVKIYVDHCDLLRMFSDACWIESHVSLNGLWPGTAPEPMFGTCDFSAVYGDTLEVVDYKHGKGVPVEVVGNTQARYYGLGQYLGLESPGDVTKVLLTIIQPRAPHRDGHTRSEEITVEELLDWGENTIKKTVDDIQRGQTHLQTGSWCRWCPALPDCPAVHKNALETARMEFDDTPPAPGTLSDEDLGDILSKAALIRDWLSALQAEASRRIEHGHEVPGWKLVDKRGVRKWTDEEDVTAMLMHRGLAPEKLLAPGKMLSPPQMEKMLKRENIDPPDGFYDLIEKKVSGTTLVPESDTRQGVITGPQSDFDVVSGD